MRTTVSLVALFLLAVTSLSAKSDKLTLAQDEDDVFMSAGPALVYGRWSLPNFNATSSGTRGGGYIAVEYFPTMLGTGMPFPNRYLSVNLSLTAISEAIGTVNASAVIGGVTHTGSASADAYSVEGGIKFYLLQLIHNNDSRWQPYLLVGIAGVFFDVSATLDGTDVSDHLAIDPAFAFHIGGGDNILINKDWSVFAEAGYFTSVGDTSAKVTAFGGTASTPLRFDGLLATAGVRYRF